MNCLLDLIYYICGNHLIHSFQQFIFYNNPELKAFAKVNFIKSVKEEIISEDNNIIMDLLKKKLISIREIIDYDETKRFDDKNFASKEIFINIGYPK